MKGTFVKCILRYVALSIACTEGIPKTADYLWPKYVQSGTNVTLVCFDDSGDSPDLFWTRVYSRKENDESDDERDIIPVRGGRYVTSLFSKQPDGYVKSTLTILKVSQNDTGKFRCKSYASCRYLCHHQDDGRRCCIWSHHVDVDVAVLDIEGNVEISEHVHGESTLHCSLSTTLTNMTILWYRNDSTLPANGPKYLIKQLELFSSDIYGYGTYLIISNTVKSDTGTYTCVFSKDKGKHFEMSKEIYFDATHLDEKEAGNTATMSTWSVLGCLLVTLAACINTIR